MKVISILSIILIWLDVLFTSIFIYKFGIDIEANIIGRFLFKHPLLLVLVKLISTLCLIWLSKLDYKLAKTGLWIIFVIYSILVIYHILLTIKILIIFNR